MKSEYHPQYTLTVTAKELKLISLALVGGLKDKEDLEAAARLNLGLMSMAHKSVQEQAVSMGNAHQRARDAVGKYKKEESDVPELSDQGSTVPNGAPKSDRSGTD